VPRTVEVEEFAGRARDLVRGVAEGGESVIVVREGAPIAVLLAPDAMPAQAVLADLPRWEEWVHAVRESFAETAGKPRTTSFAMPKTPELDKALLGFDPAAGVVGSDAGREFMASELARLNAEVRDSALLGEIYAAVLLLSEEKEHLYEADLRVLAQEKLADSPRRLRVLAATVTSTTGLPATAEVTLELGHGPAMRREHGDGPLDAAFKAIQRLTGLEPEVENFSVVSATPGADAMAEAVIELLLDDRKAVGTGASTNAIEAGILAYVSALNFLLEARTPA
jgi:2-isopropylmalate synthase